MGRAALLAWADLRAEPLLAACTVLSLAAVLAPLVVLAGLRAGVVEGLRDALLQDPRTREVVTAANRSYPAELLGRLAARPDVAFLAPRTRTLAATLLLERPDAPGGGTRVELVPTALGDPLIPALPDATNAIVLSASAAARLRVQAGATLVGRLGRTREGRREAATLALTVAAVAPPSAFGREGAFVSLPLAVLVENYQDGLAAVPADVSALAPVARAEYAGFRLYARQLEDVPALDAGLTADGLEVVSRAGDVAGLLRVDRNLRLLFALVAGLGGTGFLVSLGAGLWANVERKRVPLAQLRFLGLRARAMRVFPVAQALALAGAGSALALGVAFAAAAVVNGAFAGLLALDRPLCVISPGLALSAAGATLAGAVLVSAAAGSRAARVEPWEGLSAP